jgi:hypothetical protein
MDFNLPVQTPEYWVICVMYIFIPFYVFVIMEIVPFVKGKSKDNSSRHNLG